MPATGTRNETDVCSRGEIRRLAGNQRRFVDAQNDRIARFDAQLLGERGIYNTPSIFKFEGDGASDQNCSLMPRICT